MKEYFDRYKMPPMIECNDVENSTEAVTRNIPIRDASDTKPKDTKRNKKRDTEKNTPDIREQEVESSESVCKPETDLSAQMDRISNGIFEAKDKLEEVTSSFRELLQASIELSKEISSDKWFSGIQNLCALHRRMKQSRDVYATVFRADLETILEKDFGLVKLEPMPGEAFNSMYCERMRSHERGLLIRQCKECGWMMDNNVLLRAIVDTM